MASVMDRRAFLAGSLGLLGAPHGAEAQHEAGKVARIGILSPGWPAVPLPVFEAFRQGLRDLGYVEGRNLAIEGRFAGGHDERLPELAAELVQLNVDVIVSVNTPAAVAAKRATAHIPIVFVQVADPTAADLVQSLGRPGGNLTGLVSITPELSGKRLELLREALPRVTRVGVLRDVNRASDLIAHELQAASQGLDLRLVDLPIRRPDELPNAIQEGVRDHIAALVVIDGAIILGLRQPILDLARRNHLPVLSQFRDFVDQGALMAYGPSLPEMYRRSAAYVDRILKGAKPSDLPVERPTKFELIINLKTAKALGLTIPQTLLLRADKLIE
jgi:putative tryptophan/tyrosine transport system substrate-binding protein